MESDPQKLVKSVLKTPMQKKVWDAMAVAVKKAFEQSAKAEDKAALPLCVHDIFAALYNDWSGGDMSRVLETIGTEMSVEDFVVAAHGILSGNVWRRGREAGGRRATEGNIKTTTAYMA